MRVVESAKDLGPDPYEHVIFRGKPIDQAQASALIEVEVRLGFQLTLLQGIGGAEASGGTHLEGRAVDLAPQRSEEKVRAMKDVGYAEWHRDDLPGVWSTHNHGILILETDDNDRGVSPAGFRQIAAYRAQRDGLLGNRVDPTYRPAHPRRFHYDPERTRAYEERGTVTVNHVTKGRDALTEAAHALGVAAVEFSAVSKSRTVVRAGVVTARTLRRGVNGLLAALPKS